MRKTFKIIFIVLICLILGIILFIARIDSGLSSEAISIIKEVQTSEVPGFVTGDVGFARNGDVEIWYESVQPSDSVRGVVLLSMGIGNDAMAWPGYFLAALRDSGYQVVRYDHRDTGFSDWMNGQRAHEAYTLTEMASDGIAVLDALDIEQAHCVGMSMGGMISQEMAIRFPGRVHSLVSLSSSCHILDPDLPPMPMHIMKRFALLYLKYGLLGGERNTMKLHLASRLMLQGDHEVDLPIRETAEQVLFNLRERNGYNYSAGQRHAAAVRASGSRYQDLEKIKVPALFIHGTADPLIHIDHGKRCASAMPQSESFWVEGMGHDVPENFNAQVVDRIVQHMVSTPETETSIKQQRD